MERETALRQLRDMRDEILTIYAETERCAKIQKRVEALQNEKEHPAQPKVSLKPENTAERLRQNLLAQNRAKSEKSRKGEGIVKGIHVLLQILICALLALDLFGGKEDLENGIIRCVGDADERFDEDALRILRAVRFAAQLDFDIEKKTAAAITGHAENLEAVSRERILTEISKLICSAHPEKISEIFELGLAAHISDFFEEINLKQLGELAEINKSASYKALSGHKNPYINDDRTDELNHAFILSEAVPLKLRFVRFAYLCEGMAAEHVKKLLKGLKPDNDTLKYTVLLAEQLLKPLPTERYELKRLMSKTEPELFYCLLRLKELSAGTLLYKENIKASDEPENLTETRLLYEDILEKGEPVYLRELALTGGDLIKLGVKPGPELGRLLSELLDAVHREPAENNTADLSELVQTNISQHTKNSQI